MHAAYTRKQGLHRFFQSENPMTLIRGREAPISNKLTRYLPLPMLRAVYGFILSLGAPLGWVLIQWLADRDPFSERYFDGLLYGYMTVATAIVFSVLGYLVGHREELITHMALRDGLTGLYNKRYFSNRLEQEFDRHKRHALPLSLIPIDLDHFKAVNDTYGHEAGDATLQHVARILKTNCRKNEVAARVGGEELCVLAVECLPEHAAAIAERLREHIEQEAVQWQGQTISITASFGVAAATPELEDPWAIYRAADAALYRAKESGRNRVCLAEPGDFNDENAIPH